MAMGTFSAEPQTEWVSGTRAAPDRNMTLLRDFAFTDPDGRVWPAPAGSVIDGASIPQFLWSHVGSPYTGCYRRASIVHDVACDNVAVNRSEADSMFYHACRAGGCSIPDAWTLYAGVRIGAGFSAKQLKIAAVRPGIAPTGAAANIVTSGRRAFLRATRAAARDGYRRPFAEIAAQIDAEIAASRRASSRRAIAAGNRPVKVSKKRSKKVK